MGDHSKALGILAHGPTEKAERIRDAKHAAELEARWGIKAVPPTKPKVATTANLVVEETPDVYAASLLDKPVPPEWERRLRELSPKSDHHSWLMLTWMAKPGFPSTGRWVLYECIPEAHVPTEMRDRLGGTPYWELPKERRAGRQSLVSPTQWLIWRRHRVWARPFWIIQGNTGGTPMKYSEIEQRWLKLAQQPTEPPHLGALPYAPFDGRVEAAIKKRDRMAKLDFSLERLRESGNAAAMQAEIDEAEKQWRRDFLTWWGEQLQPQAEFLEWYTRRTEADYTLRRQTRAEFLAAQRLQDEYVETGYLPTAPSGA